MQIGFADPKWSIGLDVGRPNRPMGIAHFLGLLIGVQNSADMGVVGQDNRVQTPGKEFDTFHFPFLLCGHFLYIGFFKRDRHFSGKRRIDEKGSISLRLRLQGPDLIEILSS